MGVVVEGGREGRGWWLRETGEGVEWRDGGGG